MAQPSGDLFLRDPEKGANPEGSKNRTADERVIRRVNRSSLLNCAIKALSNGGRLGITIHHARG